MVLDFFLKVSPPNVRTSFDSLPTECSLLINFTNCLDPDQAR